jgi:hypothetical protein
MAVGVSADVVTADGYGAGIDVDSDSSQQQQRRGLVVSMLSERAAKTKAEADK